MPAARLKASPVKMGGSGGGGGGGGGGRGGDVVENDHDERNLYFAAEEVEAAEIMYEAFRATKGADGQPIETKQWSMETASRVQVREHNIILTYYSKRTLAAV